MEKTILEKLKQSIDPKIVHTDADTLNSRRFDRWAINHFRDWKEMSLPTPGCVVRPRNVEDVQGVVRFASKHDVPIMPFGLGSGVCGGVVGDPDTILLDMSHMNKQLFIDEENMLASFEAGFNGLAAEEAVAAKGLTIGNWPQSIAISSVGGWVSTRASGQFSTAYGNIEDIIYAMDVVLPNGELITLGKAPRAAAGPDLRHIIMGAEGTMGIITSVTFSLRRQAEHRAYSAYYADTMERGFKAQRAIICADWRPVVMRQYDLPEVQRLFGDYVKEESSLLIMVHEGPKSRVEAELADIDKIMTAQGMTKADPEAAEGWLGHRNTVPDWTDLFKMGLIADTIEISGKWSDIGKVYNDAVAALKTVPGILNASAHSSHVYRSGINLYFTFAGMIGENDITEDFYFQCWDKVLEATAAAGGGIAHHHGAGRMRKKYLHHDLGENGVALLRTLKSAVDPKSLMNPGNLLPDTE